MKKLILFCLVVATVFAEEPTKFADGAKEVAQKDAAQKDVAQKKAHRARFEDAVKGYEDAVKEEAHAQAEEARAKAEEAHARAAKKRSLRSMLQAKGGSDLFDEVIKRMEEQDRLLKEHTAEISSLKSNAFHCATGGASWAANDKTFEKRINFYPAFKSKPVVAVALRGFKNDKGEALAYVQSFDTTGVNFGLWATGDGTSATVEFIACGH